MRHPRDPNTSRWRGVVGVLAKTATRQLHPTLLQARILALSPVVNAIEATKNDVKTIGSMSLLYIDTVPAEDAMTRLHHEMPSEVATWTRGVTMVASRVRRMEMFADADREMLEIKFPKGWALCAVYRRVHWPDVLKAISPLLKEQNPQALYETAQIAVHGKSWFAMTVYPTWL